MNRHAARAVTHLIGGCCAIIASSAFAMQDTPTTPAATPPAMPTVPAGGGVTVEFDKDYGTAQSSATQDAKSMAQQYLRDRVPKMQIGENKESGVWVAIGSATFMCGPESPDFDSCRSDAFAMAMLNAKQQLAEKLSLSVAARMKTQYAEGNIVTDLAKSREQSLQAQPDMLGKVELLANSYIDEQLQARGIDVASVESLPDTEKAKAIEEARRDAAKLLSTQQFQRAVNAAASSEVAAVQAFRTFEYIAPGKKGQIAVVAVYSPKSLQLFRALIGYGDPPKGAPKQPISDWVQEQGDDALLYTFGVQPRTDETGEVVLVAYGQATPIGTNEMQLEAAEDKAKLDALEVARYFLGELVANQRNRSREATLKAYSDASELYSSNQGYQKTCEAEAKELMMVGGSEVYSWKAQHPLSGKVTCGSVYVFSVSAAIEANKLRHLFDETKASQGGRGLYDRPDDDPKPADPKKPAKPRQPAEPGRGVPGEEP